MDTQKFGDRSEGIDPLSYTGNGMHLDLVQSVFICMACTCKNDISNKINGRIYFKIKCKGCKRKLQAFSCPFTGKLTVTEIIHPKGE